MTYYVYKYLGKYISDCKRKDTIMYTARQWGRTICLNYITL